MKSTVMLLATLDPVTWKRRAAITHSRAVAPRVSATMDVAASKQLPSEADKAVKLASQLINRWRPPQEVWGAVNHRPRREIIVRRNTLFESWSGVPLTTRKIAA
jgi:hypothetical protein